MYVFPTRNTVNFLINFTFLFATYLSKGQCSLFVLKVPLNPNQSIICLKVFRFDTVVTAGRTSRHAGEISHLFWVAQVLHVRLDACRFVCTYRVCARNRVRNTASARVLRPTVITRIPILCLRSVAWPFVVVVGQRSPSCRRPSNSFMPSATLPVRIVYFCCRLVAVTRRSRAFSLV